LELGDDGFVFSFEPGGETPPHPDAMSHIFAKVRDAADIASDIHLHSLRHFQATALDPVVPERQKQARLGWSTVHMARHYTDAIGAEDRKAAAHIGQLLSADVAQGPAEEAAAG
jgi:integrase